MIPVLAVTVCLEEEYEELLYTSRGQWLMCKSLCSHIASKADPGLGFL